MFSETIFLNLANLTPAFLLIAPLFAYLTTQDPVQLYFAIYLVIAGFLGNDFFKFITYSIAPNNPAFKRPQQIHASMKKCNVYPNIFAISWGMPSGHAQISALGATFWSLYLLSQQKNPTIGQYIISIIFCFIAIVVSYSRIYQGYHNSLQVIIGFLIGVFQGWFLFYLLRRQKIIS